MGEPAEQITYYTREEYLAMEEEAYEKSEFYDGEIFAMAGGSRNHSVICFNLIRRIGEGIDGKDCVGFDSNMKLHISEHNLFLYPDLMAVCGDPEFYENRTDTLLNPVLITEVLSPSTQAFDRGDKFAYYRTLPSLREYVLVSQKEPLVEVYRKQDETSWICSFSKGLANTVIFETIQHKILLADIYQKVDW